MTNKIIELEQDIIKNTWEKYYQQVDKILEKLSGNNEEYLKEMYRMPYSHPLPENYWLIEEYGINIEGREALFWGIIKYNNETKKIKIGIVFSKP